MRSSLFEEANKDFSTTKNAIDEKGANLEIHVNISFILVTAQILSGGTSTNHQLPFESQKECILAGERWLEEERTRLGQQDQHAVGSIWFYCQPARGETL
jgi:hypothetical protein